MQFDLNELREIRKKFDLTQHDLAKRANVSQSLIAKIEAGRLDPTFSKAQQIFDAIESFSNTKEVKAEEIMIKSIISLKPDDDIRDAIKKMKRNNISQIPVIEDHKSIGFISESILLEALLDNKSNKIKDVMNDPVPVVSHNTGATAITSLLKFFPFVLVSKNGELKGIVAKSDLINALYK